MTEETLKEAMANRLRIIGRLTGFTKDEENYPGMLIGDIQLEHEETLITITITIPERLENECFRAKYGGTAVLVMFENNKIVELAFE